MRDAITARDMFNLIDTRGGDKVDFWLLIEDPFDRARFARRYVEQFVDALRVYEIQHGRLDEDRWAGQLGVADALGRIRAQARPVE